MHLTLPLFHPQGARWIRSLVEVDIPEFTADEVPLAIRSTVTQAWRGLRTDEFRIHDGHLWTNLGGRAPSLSWIVREKLRADPMHECWSEFPGSRDMHPWQMGTYSDFRQHKKAVYSEAPDETPVYLQYRDHMLRRAGQMILIDGEPWLKSIGPLICTKPRAIGKPQPPMLMYLNDEGPWARHGTFSMIETYMKYRSFKDVEDYKRDLELVMSRRRGAVTPIEIEGPKPEVFIHEGYDLFSWPEKAAHAALLDFLWATRKIRLDDAERQLLDAIAATRQEIERGTVEPMGSIGGTHAVGVGMVRDIPFTPDAGTAQVIMRNIELCDGRFRDADVEAWDLTAERTREHVADLEAIHANIF